ncbi:unnamed protein product [Haemonchus placei]|uniref:Pecanex-like protein n=1 Tax=Haemonchus placei TaxID=6290 RepID=A0A0N4VZW7_HAEPC|nr:unnamed protein product [Haemonchus placei]
MDIFLENLFTCSILQVNFLYSCSTDGIFTELIESEYRPFRIIPHIIPIVAIIVKDETPTVITSELGADWVDLNTVLRHSYSNIEQYSQVHNFVVASLADVYYQLNLLKCYVIEPQFFCDNVFWLLCDPFVTNVDECPYEDFAYHRFVQ